MNLFRTKSIEQSIRDTEHPEHRLKKGLGALDLTVFGVGVTIGAGIFVLTGVIAGTRTGPAIAIAFVLSAAACALAALCYAEFSSSVPVAGSAYTYSYATVGEFLAWIVGWDLVLEFTIGASAVAVGWSNYLGSVAESAGVTLPDWMTGEAGVNLGAAFIVLVLTAVLVLGIKLSSRVNWTVVVIKTGVVLFVIIAGLFYVKASNWTPFVPPPGTEGAPLPGGGADTGVPLVQLLFGYEPGAFGWSGVFAGAALVFFAFIGFDVVATAAEETKRPQRDLPIGILSSLAIVTVLYVAVSLVVTGMVPFNEIDTEAPLAEAFRSVGRPGFAALIAFGALTGLTTVMMILMLGQSRVLFAMSRDGLLPRGLSKVSPRFGTPYRTTVITGGVVAVIAALVPLDELAELVNIGTLFAFVLVAAGVMILRRTRPDLPRGFRTPWVPVVPILAILACGWLMLNLPTQTWLRFLVWLALGVVVYFLYGARRSRVATGESEQGRRYDLGGVAADATPGSAAELPGRDG